MWKKCQQVRFIISQKENYKPEEKEVESYEEYKLYENCKIAGKLRMITSTALQSSHITLKGR